MKKLFLIASLFISAIAVQAQDLKAENVIKVNAEKYDFGKIKQNVPVTTFFEITNISDKPVVIENAWAGCGCTTPEWTKEPIAPKATTKIKVGYNAAALNHFDKDVFVKLVGVNEPKVLKISGDVLDEAAYSAYEKENKKASAPKTSAATKAKPATKKTK
jgi:hypothetical protein